MIKKALKYLFRKTGYSLVKNQRNNASGYTMVRVGKFDIRINNDNGLRYDYVNLKDYGAQLSRLADLTKAYYKDLEVIDVGSNLGDSVALIRSGADVPVICVEGDDALIGLFKQNTAQFDKITLIKKFLSDSTGELNCVYSKEGHNLTIKPAERSENSVVTKFSSTDDLYMGGDLNNNCKLLKIDTEGFDLKILKGSSTFLDSVKPVILFEFNRENLDDIEEDPFAIFPSLLAKGYDQVLFYENTGRFIFSSSLIHQKTIKQFYDYADGKHSTIPYLDIIAFHATDGELAADFINREEKHRLEI